MRGGGVTGIQRQEKSDSGGIVKTKCLKNQAAFSIFQLVAQCTFSVQDVSSTHASLRVGARLRKCGLGLTLSTAV